MDLDRFNFRGARIGLAGVAMALAPVAVGDHLPRWLLFASALTGIALGFVGGGVHYYDMFKTLQVDAEDRKAWIRQYGDPDQRDDPAGRP
jgi:hypothetical protein